MRLQSLTLHGFKSFGDKTPLRILPGITAIVGPNGCGKSNLSEAVRWALGEQSAKSLRGQRMEDLIFHGSASRKPVGLAEVELTFANDGDLGIPFSEVSVMRRLYRTGESEYLLNKAVCRLRDILDLFAGTGANPRAYSVMDQDKLNHVLTAKPHERRLFIEEAAGIARYKQQRTETQGKLEGTRQNLVRVRDVMDEVRRQLGSLERQARKATQYKALQQERRELTLALAAADYVALLSAATRVAAEVTRLRGDEDALRARTATFAAQQAQHRESIQVSDHRLSDLRQSVQKVQGELERLLERREQMGLQIRESAEEAARLQVEIVAIEERLTALASEREALRSGLVESEAAARDRAEAAEAVELEVEQHRAGLGVDRDRLEAFRLEQVRLVAERTDLVRNAGELRERQAQLERRAERLAAELSELEAEVSRLVGARGAVELARASAIDTLSTLVAERDRLEAELGDRERRLAEETTRVSELRVDLAGRRSSLESLRALEEAREGYGAGVRAIFADGVGARLPGIVGTVADLLDVPRDLEAAIEAALGERLEWVVVERYEHARAAVEFLAREGAGVATFLPLESLVGVPGGRAATPVTSDDYQGAGFSGITPIMTTDVRAAAPGLVQHLLGHVVITDDLEHAEALWRRNGVVATYVTRAGEVLAASWLRGGSPRTTVEHSLLGRKRELRTLEVDVDRLEKLVSEGQAGIAGLDTEAVAIRGEIPRFTQAIAASEAKRVASEKDLEQWVREHERIERHRATIGVESTQIRAEAEDAGLMHERLERRIAAARETEAARDSAMAVLRETLEHGQQHEADLTAALTACRVDAAAALERVEAITRDLGRVEQMEADLAERVAQSRARRGQAIERRGWLEQERERTDASARDVAVDRDRLEEDARAAAAHHEGLLAELREIETQMRAVDAELRTTATAIHELELRATEDRVRGEELVQDARRTHGIDETALRDRYDAGRDLDAARGRVTELAEKIDAIGAVNLVADDEYRELDERLTFLRTQHDDLVASVKDLEKALRGMTRTAQERFAQMFEEVNGHFSKLFERLFEGGRAELRLVPPDEGDDPLDTGVELMAQPRGKRLQAVTLLSGGERALTGLALLFAIFYARPSPFCVLDEVDAPLDDANIVRFLRVLRELTSQTQFLVITHNRKTMEAADVLYGVTMEEPGLSRLVSVNLNS